MPQAMCVWKSCGPRSGERTLGRPTVLYLGRARDAYMGPQSFVVGTRRGGRVAEGLRDSRPSPAAGDDLLAGVEVDGVGAVGVEVAVHRVLPAGEGEPS